MIDVKDQEQLFTLISNYLENDISCIAIGGTAMMFRGYKTTTKDIDLVFASKKDRDVFIKAIEQIGYVPKAIGVVYDEKRKNDKNKPVIYSRGDERFDLFVKNVFGFELDANNFVQRDDFIGKKELIIRILSKEFLVLLKSITGRERDYEDIETIMGIEKELDWKLVVSAAILQKNNTPWILVDLEETLQELKKKYFIKQEIFDMIYSAEGK